MRLFLRVAPEANLKIAKNYEFKPEKNIHIILHPIPEFVGKVKCDCGEPATVFLNEEIYKCNTCISLLISHTNNLMSNDDTSSPITIQSVKDMRLEWSANGDKWYNLWGKNIETNNWDSFIKDLKSMIIDKKEIEINGYYDQDTKHLSIT
jgi:hypothetical protein